MKQQNKANCFVNIQVLSLKLNIHFQVFHMAIESVNILLEDVATCSNEADGWEAIGYKSRKGEEEFHNEDLSLCPRYRLFP